MITSIMLVGLGFLVAAFCALVFMPLVHKRAVRLTTRLLENALPQSITEVYAEKDQLRAQFAVLTRDFESKIDNLKTKTTHYIVDIANKDKSIKKLTSERDGHLIEIATMSDKIEQISVKSNELIDRLESKTRDYQKELQANHGVIHRLRVERDSLRAEISALKRIGARAVRGDEVKAEVSDEVFDRRSRESDEVTMMTLDSVSELKPSAYGSEQIAASFLPVADVFKIPEPRREQADSNVAGEAPEPPSDEKPSEEPEIAGSERFQARDAAHVENIQFGTLQVPPSGTSEVSKADPGRETACRPEAQQIEDLEQKSDFARRGPALSAASSRTGTLKHQHFRPPDSQSRPDDIPNSSGDAVETPPSSEERRADPVLEPTQRAEPAKAEPLKVEPVGEHHGSDAVSRLWTRLESVEVRSDGLQRDPDVGFEPRADRMDERTESSARQKTGVPAIHLSSNDGFAANKSERSRVPRLLAAVPIVAGASLAWQYYGSDATEMIKSGISPLDLSSSVWTANAHSFVEGLAGRSTGATVHSDDASAQSAVSQSSAAASVSTPSDSSAEHVLGELQAVVRDLATLRRSTELTSTDEQQTARTVAARPAASQRVERGTSWGGRTVAPDTRPTTIPGWTLLAVTDDAVVLQGPNGILSAARGDLVPGVGTIDSVVRWGSRWIVATSRGLVSTP